LEKTAEICCHAPRSFSFHFLLFGEAGSRKFV
jgi:hypothetical protein